VRRVVYASSSSVYGAASSDAVKREDLPIAPLSPYGVAKYAGEAYCSSFSTVYGLETVSLRYFNVFGPRQSPISEYAAVIPNFLAAALLNERPTIYGDGEQSRDFTYVANVVAANIAAAHAVQAGGETFNIACGESYTINDLLKAVSAVSGRALEPIYASARLGEVRRSQADIAKARRLLGYEPEVRLEPGLKACYEHFLSDDAVLPEIRERRRWISVAR
jgi:nucleoside-diphosphate-sugar epimerase